MGLRPHLPPQSADFVSEHAFQSGSEVTVWRLRLIALASSLVTLASCSDFQPRQSSVAQGQFFGFEDAQSFGTLSARKSDDIAYNWPATIAARNLAQPGVTDRDLALEKTAMVKCALSTDYVLWW
jgi:hypothetical protein